MRWRVAIRRSRSAAVIRRSRSRCRRPRGSGRFTSGCAATPAGCCGRCAAPTPTMCRRSRWRCSASGAVQPARLAASLRRRADSLGTVTGVRWQGRRRTPCTSSGGIPRCPRLSWPDTEELALTGVAAHMPEGDLREEQRLVGTLLGWGEGHARPTTASCPPGCAPGCKVSGQPAAGERVIVFTEYRDTLDYLEAHLGTGPLLRIDGTVRSPAAGRSWSSSPARHARSCSRPTPPGRA